jgi:hypothetical protein
VEGGQKLRANAVNEVALSATRDARRRRTKRERERERERERSALTIK